MMLKLLENCVILKAFVVF